MASNIDPLYPAEGDSPTLEERANFQYAHDEIEALQTGKSDTAHLHSGVYEPANANIQSHVSSTADPHNVTKTQVGLSNADNTSDANKPISTATQTALDAKVAGPASAVGDNLAVFDLTTGKLIKDSGSSVSDFEVAGAAATVQSDLNSHKDHGNLHMTADERAAMDAANAPDGLNPFATVDDLGGGSGHVIQDPAGDPMATQPNLQFVGDVEVTDDNPNSRTVVNVTAGAGSGEANTSTNTGTGAGVAGTKVGVNLPFRSLNESGAGMTITENSTDITFSLNYAGSGDLDTLSRSNHQHEDVYDPAGTGYSEVLTHENKTDPASAHDIDGISGLQTALDSKVSSETGVGDGNFAFFDGTTGRLLKDLPLSPASLVSKVGTPVDNQLGVWTGDGTIEGGSSLTFDGSTLYVSGQGIEAGATTDLFSATNSNGSAITIGQAVYVDGSGTVDLAQADAAATDRAIGLVADASIAAAASGSIRHGGVVSSANWTSVIGSTNLTAGADYFLSAATAGRLTATAPTTAGQFVVYVGHAVSTSQMLIGVERPIGV